MNALQILLHTTNTMSAGESTFSGQIFLTGNGKSKIERRPVLDHATLIATGKPTRVTRGAFHGFSMPIYAADDEELFFRTTTPNRWDEESDIICRVRGWIDTANTDKKFKLQLSYAYAEPGDVLGATTTDLETETSTGTAAQYTEFKVEFTIDYNSVAENPISKNDLVAMRLRRIEASSDEITGEFVIGHVGLVFQRNKMGEAI